MGKIMNDISLMGSIQFGAQKDEKIYGISILGGVLIEYSMRNNKLRVVEEIEDIYLKWAYSSYCYFEDDTFYALSNLKNEILVYSFSDNTWRFVTLNGVRNAEGAFSGIFTHNKKIVIVTKYDKECITINPENERIDYIEIPDIDTIFYSIKKGQYLYCLLSTYKLVKINLDDYSCSTIIEGKVLEKVIKLDFCDKYIYALKVTGEIIIINYEGKKNMIIPPPEEEYKAGSFTLINRGIIVLPGVSKSIYMYSDNHWCKIAEVSDSYTCLADPPRGYFENYCLYENDFFFLTKKLGRFFVINKESGQTKWLVPEIIERRDFIKLYMDRDKIIREDELDLCDFISLLK